MLLAINTCLSLQLNMTYRFSGDPDDEKAIFSEVNCSKEPSVKERFSKDKFTFGGSKDNTTFYIYVQDFAPPLVIVISFSQHPKLDLLQFFITFSTCFLLLLLIAAVLWKIKQRYDRYRRRQRLFVEMEQMASRPFGSVLVELERAPRDTSQASSSHHNSSSGNADRVTAAASTSSSSSVHPLHPANVVSSVSPTTPGTVSPAAEDAVVSLVQPSSSTTSTGNLSYITSLFIIIIIMIICLGVRKRKKRGYRPSPIALEPCDGNRAAVLSLIVRLPTGGKAYAPPGYTGIAVASSLVTLGKTLLLQFNKLDFKMFQ